MRKRTPILLASVAILLASVAFLLAGCAGPRAIAVINETEDSFVVRFEGQWAWSVPPGSAGIGPTDLIMGPRLTEILRDDCSWWVSWRLIGPSTIRITDTGAIPSLAGGVEASAQLEATDQCLPDSAGA
jgi:hypothetical protein